MSRHKLVKNLDLDDELDDYDGGEDYGDYEDAEGTSLIFCDPPINANFSGVVRNQ